MRCSLGPEIRPFPPKKPQECTNQGLDPELNVAVSDTTRCLSSWRSSSSQRLPSPETFVIKPPM